MRTLIWALAALLNPALVEECPVPVEVESDDDER